MNDQFSEEDTIEIVIATVYTYKTKEKKYFEIEYKNEPNHKIYEKIEDISIDILAYETTHNVSVILKNSKDQHNNQHHKKPLTDKELSYLTGLLQVI